MAKSNLKVSNAEYLSRTLIDVSAKVIAPVLTFGTGWLIYNHGEDIYRGIEKKIKNRKKK